MSSEGGGEKRDPTIVLIEHYLRIRDALSGNGTEDAREDELPTAMEVLEIVKAYFHIKNPETRRKAVEIVKSLSDTGRFD